MFDTKRGHRAFTSLLERNIVVERQVVEDCIAEGHKVGSVHLTYARGVLKGYELAYVDYLCLVVGVDSDDAERRMQKLGKGASSD